MNCLKSFAISISLIIFNSFIYALLFLFLKNEIYTYFLTYILLSIFFTIIYKNKIKQDFFKLRNISLKQILFIILFIALSFISEYILLNSMKTNSLNQKELENMISSSPLLMSIMLTVFSPFVEEVIYRLPYKKGFVSICLSTIIFALVHLNLGNSKDLIFFIPYMFLSISLSVAYFKDENILTSTFAHILNNLIAIMVLFI